MKGLAKMGRRRTTSSWVDRLANIGTGILLACMLLTFFIKLRATKEQAVGTSVVQPEVRLADEIWTELIDSRTVPTTAVVRAVVFSDYQCPACASLEDRLTALEHEHPGRLSVIYRQFPLKRIHPHAPGAALAAECARNQDRFLPYHSALFDNPKLLVDNDWEQIARIAGVANPEQLVECVFNEQSAGRIEVDGQLASRLGISGTPGVVVNGKLLPAGLPIGRIIEVTQSELKMAERT